MLTGRRALTDTRPLITSRRLGTRFRRTSAVSHCATIARSSCGSTFLHRHDHFFGALARDHIGEAVERPGDGQIMNASADLFGMAGKKRHGAESGGGIGKNRARERFARLARADEDDPLGVWLEPAARGADPQAARKTQSAHADHLEQPENDQDAARHAHHMLIFAESRNRKRPEISEALGDFAENREQRQARERAR
jgi:hypothetical protein